MTCKDMVPLTELAKQYSEESPGYVIQSWMRSRNTLEFLRQWENDTNGGFDDDACVELIHQVHTTSLTITPSLWIRKTHAVGMYVKQGNAEHKFAKCEDTVALQEAERFLERGPYEARQYWLAED